MFENSEILKSLYALQDTVYRGFNSKLIPNVSPDNFIGVRTPVLRKMAKDMLKSGEYKDFILSLPHQYFEENQLHAFILSDLKDYDITVKEVDKFLPYVDNWATCDQMSPCAFRKNRDALLKYIVKWIKSKNAFAVRFGVLCLMRYFLDDDFDVKYIEMVVNIKSKEYYVNMMRAWYFATATAKHFDKILPYLQKGKIDEWTRKCAIQKALESYRVSDEYKGQLRALR